MGLFQKTMMLLLLIICLSTISLTNAVAVVNNRVVYHFNVTYAENSSSIVLINNEIPGPLIEAELNDIIIVHCTNNLQSNESFTIHFHGLLQRLTPQMDGVPFVTQMPIQSQTSFTYVFRAYPAGTYFYHSHVGLQAVTAFGPLIINDRRRPWNVPEVSSGPIMFSDTWLSPDRLTQQEGLLGSQYIWEGEPTYLLINNQRDFVLTVAPDTQYLLRLICATSLSAVAFAIDEHPMTVVEADGALIQPTNVTSIELASGQRYVVIIQTKPQASRVYLMQLAIRWREVNNGSK
jgi:FtsP/CotA-like multicopper oxidase with cupredoxin domain